MGFALLQELRGRPLGGTSRDLEEMVLLSVGLQVGKKSLWLAPHHQQWANSLTSQAHSLVNWENELPEKGTWAERSLLLQRACSAWLSAFTAAHEAFSCGGCRGWAAGNLHGGPQILVLCLVHKLFFLTGHTQKNFKYLTAPVNINSSPSGLLFTAG